MLAGDCLGMFSDLVVASGTAYSMLAGDEDNAVLGVLIASKHVYVAQSSLRCSLRHEGGICIAVPDWMDVWYPAFYSSREANGSCAIAIPLAI